MNIYYEDFKIKFLLEFYQMNFYWQLFNYFYINL